MVDCRLAAQTGDQTASVEGGVCRQGDVELEQPEVTGDHGHRYVVDRDLADRPFEGSRVGVPVQYEVGLVLGDGRGQTICPQITPDSCGLADDRLLGRRV